MNTLNLTIPGFSIACNTWGTPDKPPILALHGWLDNANSFVPLAPYFEKDFYLIAPDLPGHGHSSHLPVGCNYHFIDGIFTVVEIINALQLEKVHLLGHSRGACMGSLVAGVAPEKIHSLGLIEGIGPLSSPEETACKQLSAYADFVLNKKRAEYKGYEQASSAALARAMKGNVSLDIAKIFCERALLEKEGRFYWRHDQRLLSASPLRMTEAQIISCLQEITAKTFLIWSTEWFTTYSEAVHNRIAAVKNITVKHLNGGHHIHMEQPEVVSQLLVDFYRTI